MRALETDQTGQLYIKGVIRKDVFEAEELHAATWERSVSGRKNSQSPKVRLMCSRNCKEARGECKERQQGNQICKKLCKAQSKLSGSDSQMGACFTILCLHYEWSHVTIMEKNKQTKT